MIKLDNHAYYKALGARIAHMRKEQGMTQAELASVLGMSQQSVFAYELGERRVPVLLLPRLADTFAISVQELIEVSKPVRAKKQRVSPKIARHVARIQQLNRTDQRFVFRLIDSLAARHNR